MYESGENYLETILRLREKNGTVRSIDIAHELNFSKPSVSRAIGILKEDGMRRMPRAGRGVSGEREGAGHTGGWIWRYG